ncbi:MAG: TIGR02757 family protein [Ignavibacteria bacterium]|nr:TIGR02757 family protein [Ignavibacteria bacterium]MBT8382197.1 TIGR02757 family protein [Ignavibacteria bacterium]MBT8390193.1 TIGR02757 family protein [Ignavibacteria bacterium]NNJ53999.1 TIGR02757 family protein [Ignavibacteriaceae bacterium]
MNLKQKLEYHYKSFDRSKLEPDPLQFPHMFSDKKDIEVMALIASVFAYGNVKQINSSLNKFLKIAENEPHKFIRNYKYSVKSKSLIHRFYSENDVCKLFVFLQSAYNEYGSLENLFLAGLEENHLNLKNTITNFSNYFLSKSEKEFGEISRGIRFMFPLPEKGSACKRMNLFLRWMVRKDELDFGLWNEIPTKKLIIPVDTHIARVCKELKLTKQKNVNWKMAEEITENLKKFDPKDPVKYDFALCHIGMRKMKF